MEDGVLLLSVSPILVLMVEDPNSFILGWNEGRGPILFGLMFLFLEWREARSRLSLNLNGLRRASWTISFSTLAGYYVLVYFAGLQEIIRGIGYRISVPEAPYLLSWTWLWEYVIVAVSLAGMLASAYTVKALAEVVTPIVYFLGMASILGLDAAFPYQSLGPLASIVPIIVGIIVALLSLSGVKVSSNPLSPVDPPWIYSQGNLLLIGGLKRSVLLEINWPCVGIMSMLIYILVLSILMVKMEAPPKRKALYGVIGALGTFSVNILRIFLITLAVAYTDIDLRVFHESIGEILFIIWIIAYLAVIVYVEGRLTSVQSDLRMLDEPSTLRR
ncbi:MAG: archaeosortase/exosortase family protein [Candidatus Bathyarchaeia archaeon]